MDEPSAVPIVDVAAEVAGLREELLGVVDSVLRSGRFVLGPNLERFEGEAASYLGARHVVGVNSGTDALAIGLRALGAGPGDEVVTTPFTFFATAEAMSLIGARPIFVDIEPSTYNIDPVMVAERLTPAVRAIVPVHLFGFPAAMGDLLEIADEHGVAVVEDAAQAFGAEWKGRKLGTVGSVGAFSFFPSKNLAACGDAGLLVTDDDRLAELAVMLRHHGSSAESMHQLVGYNSRLDEIQAAILRVKLRHVDERNGARRRIAGQYDEQLRDVEHLARPPVSHDGQAVYHQYTVRILDHDRDEVRRQLLARGIRTRVYYPTPLHLLPVYLGSGAFPHAEQAAREVLSLPIWPEMGTGQIERVTEALRACLI